MATQKHLKYAKISLKRRMKLVSFVEGGMTIVRAALKLGIKSSTAKLIVKRFRTDGTYYESKACKMQRAEEENEPHHSQNVLLSLQSNVRETLPPPDLNATQWIIQSFPTDFYYQMSPYSSAYYVYHLNSAGWGLPQPAYSAN